MAEFERLHAGNSEVQEKQALATEFAQTSTVGLAATGVLTGLAVRQTTTASGSVILGAGSGVIGSTVGAGASQPVNPGDVTFDVFTANPVGGLPRNDIMVWDSATRLFGVVVGTPNASPTDPTVANTKLPLARLRHAASATTIPTAKIDDLRVTTHLAGVLDRAVTAAAGVSGPITTAWVTLVAAPTVIGDGVKKFQITFVYQEAYSTNSGDTCRFGIRNAAGPVGLYQDVVLSGAWANGRTMVAFDTPAAGVVAYTGNAQRSAGTGTITVNPSQIIVQQIA